MNPWALFGLAVSGLVLFVANWVRLGQAQAAGAKIQAGAAAAVTARTETAIAKAEAAAPTTKAALVDRIKAGTF